jgi:hypothetical protein
MLIKNEIRNKKGKLLTQGKSEFEIEEALNSEIEVLEKIKNNEPNLIKVQTNINSFVIAINKIIQLDESEMPCKLTNEIKSEKQYAF